MGIRLESAEQVETITYNMVHLLHLEIEQHQQKYESDPNIYKVVLKWRYYGVDSKGKRHYKDVVIQKYDDFIALATEQAQRGDMTLIDAFQSVQVAVGTLVSLKTGIQANTV